MTKLGSLEKRVEKLEEQIASLMNKTPPTRENTPHTKSQHHKTKKHHKPKKHHKADKHTKTHKKRKINKYFQMMLAAKKAGEPSFVYNGHTYKGTKHPRLGMVYKK
jgi:hypothetical protein|tara:strand:+ start:4440 stop:4757 length:318 start_codon:yes stop_codon:yes gene_type:complete